jgi:hypothetical protein
MTPTSNASVAVDTPQYVADAAEIARFLNWCCAGALICLTSIAAGNTETRTFDSVDHAVQFAVSRNNAGANVYVMLNSPREPLFKKAKKDQVAAANFLWVDLDPRPREGLDAERTRILARLRNASPPFSAIIDSGGGFWGIYRLGTPRALNGDHDIADVEARGLGLELAYEGDNCRNVDRICRLAGTVNWPDEKKFAKGRRPALSRVVELTTYVYELDVFEAAPNAPGPITERAHAPRTEAAPLLDIDALDQWAVPDRVKRIIEHGSDPDNEKPGDNSRSVWAFDVACNLRRSLVPDNVIVAVLTNPLFGISASVLDKGPRAHRYAVRQVERAKICVELEAADFRTDDRGKPYPTQHNIRVALHKLGVVVRFDEFGDRFLIAGLQNVGPILSDAAISRLWLQIEQQFSFRPSKEYFVEVITDHARRDTFHPVCDFLDGLTWDGVPRLDRWLVTYGCADDTPYTRSVGAIILMAAVRRARQPGCKFDEMPVFESAQGLNKSSALAVLAVRDEWFTDDLPLNADSQKVIERLAGRWIVEAAELAGMRRGDIEHLKAFQSRRRDCARPAYGRMSKDAPRQSIIIGTTNSDSYLRDGTGNRRFWPVKVGRFALDALKRDVDQLWAEAAVREARGESIRLDPSLWPSAGEQQELRCVEDPFFGRFREVLGDLEGKLKAEDAWAILNLPPGQRTQEHNARLGAAMIACGFERKKARFGGKNPDWAYVRGDGSQRVVIRTDYHGNAEATLSNDDESGPAPIDPPF